MISDGPERVFDREALAREALRINQRFNDEVVVAFDICPYARMAFVDRTVLRSVVLPNSIDDFAGTLDVITAWERDPSLPEIGLLIFPTLSVTPRHFEQFNAAVRASCKDRSIGSPMFVHAVFHPDYPTDARSPDSLVYYFRRSPDPLIQLVRHSTLERVRGTGHGTKLFDPGRMDMDSYLAAPTRDVTERITRDNYAFAMDGGRVRVDAILADIAEDRKRAYATCGFGSHGAP